MRYPLYDLRIPANLFVINTYDSHTYNLINTLIFGICNNSHGIFPSDLTYVYNMMLTPFLLKVQRSQTLTVSGNFSALIFDLMRRIGFVSVLETKTHR